VVDAQCCSEAIWNHWEALEPMFLNRSTLSMCRVEGVKTVATILTSYRNKGSVQSKE
jgi:Fe-S cluster biosynthesis and repair protein YggX